MSQLEPLPKGMVDDLLRPGGHPRDPSARDDLRPIQTHISHVILTGARAYKLRKAVDLGFLSFATRALRDADCEREVALNRRLAPDVYLGVAPIVRGAHGFEVGEVDAGGRARGDGVEHCVVMRRLPDGRDALSLLQRGALRPEQLDRVAAVIARFHERSALGTPAPYSAEDWQARIRRPVEANLEALAGGGVVAPDAVAALRQAIDDFLARHGERFEARRLAGRAVEGHGDLHLQHVIFERDHGDPLFIDCIEFDADLRRIDAAAEVAFLAMDLRYRGEAALGERFLRRYAREADDFGLYAVVDFFVSYRAGVRAKVAALAAGEEEIEASQRRRATESARRHLDLARAALRGPGRGALVVVCGTVGTGKSTAAELLAETLGGVVIASDRVRKRLAGLATTERARGGARDALYAPGTTERVYAGLLERAAPVLLSGRTAILDATFDLAAHREAALAYARAHDTEAWLLEVRCAPEMARERLERRAASDRDPSDAGPERLEPSRARFEPPVEWPAANRLLVDTGIPHWQEALGEGARRRLGRETDPAT